MIERVSQDGKILYAVSYFDYSNEIHPMQAVYP